MNLIKKIDYRVLIYHHFYSRYHDRFSVTHNGYMNINHYKKSDLSFRRWRNNYKNFCSVRYK